MTVIFFFFNDTATTEIYTLSLHDALPISELAMYGAVAGSLLQLLVQLPTVLALLGGVRAGLGWSTPELHGVVRSEEHTSELQSLAYLVCRLLLEKKKKKTNMSNIQYRFRT